MLYVALRVSNLAHGVYGKTMKEVHNTIRTLRFLFGEMTQAELAEKVGVSRRTIVAVEKGEREISLSLAFRIAEVFDMPITKVFSYT